MNVVTGGTVDGVLLLPRWLVMKMRALWRMALAAGARWVGGCCAVHAVGCPAGAACQAARGALQRMHAMKYQLKPLLLSASKCGHGCPRSRFCRVAWAGGGRWERPLRGHRAAGEGEFVLQVFCGSSHL